MTNEIATIDKIPAWTNLCDGDWLEMKELKPEQLPRLNEIDATIKNLTAKRNCNFSEAASFAKELSLPAANNDARMKNPRFGKLIVKLFMEYPPEIVDQAIDNLMFNLKWYPEPEVIKQELEKCYSPVKIAVARAKTIAMLVRFNNKSGNTIGIEMANPSDVIKIQDRFARAENKK